MACTVLSRNRRSGNPHLIVAGSAAQLYSRCHDAHACRKAAGKTGRFLGGRDDSVASTVRRQSRKKVNLLLDGRREPHFRQVAVRQAGDNGQRKNLESWIRRGGCDRSLENGAAARSVHRHHARAELACGTDGCSDGVRDFMKLQVQKDFLAHGNQFSYNGWTYLGQKLQAHFVEARFGAKQPNQLQGFLPGIKVKGDDYR